MHVISTAAPSSAISLRLCSPLRCSVRLPLYFSVSKLGFCRLVKKVEITFSGYNPDLTADPSRGMVDVSSSLPYISTFLCCSEIRIFCGYSQLHERRDRKRKKKKNWQPFPNNNLVHVSKGHRRRHSSVRSSAHKNCNPLRLYSPNDLIQPLYQRITLSQWQNASSYQGSVFWLTGYVIALFP